MKWSERVVLAWLRRNDRNSRKFHPVRGLGIYRRRPAIIDRALAGARG